VPEKGTKIVENYTDIQELEGFLFQLLLSYKYLFFLLSKSFTYTVQTLQKILFLWLLKIKGKQTIFFRNYSLFLKSIRRSV